MRRLAALLFVLALAAACNDPLPEGLRLAPPDEGPKVVFDLFARPLPDIPFPNDIGTRPDRDSPTGLRLNVPVDAPTANERRTRRELDTLDGFGTFAPISVSFDAPLDLDDLARRHRDNLAFADDAVFVVALDPASPDYAEPVLLDLGRGNFPALQDAAQTAYFPGDSRQGEPALLFETVDEDLDGDGVLDPGEDTDNDEVLDQPNVWPPGTAVEDGLLTCYESETNTLLLRPVVPLRERTTYAVLLTRRLLGRDGRPVRSPFPYVHHIDQTVPLRRLDDVFARWRERGIAVGWDEVAFAWTFTTQSVTADLVAIREGLYGVGPLGWLADRFPAAVTPALANTDPGSPSPYLLEQDLLALMAQAVFSRAFDMTEAQTAGVVEDSASIDYVVQGTFVSPSFLGADDAPLLRRRFHVDPRTGEARAAPEEIRFTLAVPRVTADHGPPFPVAVYSHGFGMARIEPLAFAGILARYGIATVGIDAWGHGLDLAPGDLEQLQEFGDLLRVRPFIDVMVQGRGRDLSGDGRIDPGADTYTSYAFHTRDATRQTLVDTLQLVRALRGFDGRARWPVDQDGDGLDDPAGDFNGDGVVDVGGPDLPYFAWGSSMGGLETGVLGALEPAVVAAVPVSGGGGLTNLVSRSRQPAVTTDSVLRAVGPVLVGAPDPDDPARTRLTLVHALARRVREMPVATIDGVLPGDAVSLVNDDSGAIDRGVVPPSGRFHLHLQCDEGDRFHVTFERSGEELARVDRWAEDAWYQDAPTPDFRAGERLAAPADGWGYRRGSPALRRMLGFAQLVLEPADPINYLRHFFLEPLDIRPEGPRTTNLLILATLGDMMNPSDLHGAAARAAGILDYRSPDPRYGMTQNDWLIANRVYEGLCGLGRFPPNSRGEEVLFDPDALDTLAGAPGEDVNGFDAPGPPPGRELRATVPTATGQAGIRWAHLLPCGKHGFFVTDPAKPFNIDEYLTSLVADFFRTRGRRILDDACHEDSSCPLEPW